MRCSLPANHRTEWSCSTMDGSSNPARRRGHSRPRIAQNPGLSEGGPQAFMTRHIRITLEKRRVSSVARLLDEDAPLTSAAVWDALPQGGPVYHAKYARNEIY